MSLKYCQGPKCHTYTTTDRLKGMKGSKTFQTRRRSNLYYGQGNFCSMNCQSDWFKEFGNQAIDHFGRLTFPLKLTEQNAWVKDYDYRSYRPGEVDVHYFVNKITKERRPLTKQQYDDNFYTLNTGE